MGGVVVGGAAIGLSTFLYATLFAAAVKGSSRRLAFAMLFVKLAAFLGLGWLVFVASEAYRPDPLGFVVGDQLHARGGRVGSSAGAEGLMEHGYNWLHGLPLPEHISTAILVALLLVVFAMRVRPKLANVEGALEPDEGITARNVAEAVVEGISGLAEGVIGHHYEQYVPLLAAFFVFILVANLIGLVPGFAAAHLQLQHHVRPRADLLPGLQRVRPAGARAATT